MSTTTSTAKARADLKAAIDGLDLPEHGSACALCGRTSGKGSKRRREITEWDADAGPVPSGWREIRRQRWNVNDIGEPVSEKTIITLERVWRLCRDCVFAHELDDGPMANEWPVIAVLTALGYERTVTMMAGNAEHERRVLTWEPDLVNDARRVVRTWGSFAYRHHGVPADPGSARAWAHLDGLIERARRMFAEAEQQRQFEAEYGRQSPSKTPCVICGVTHAHEWGQPPRPEPGRNYPPDLEVCDPCGEQWTRHREGSNPGYSFLDWAASKAAALTGVSKGLGRRVAFVLANRHPAFLTVEPGTYRPPWHYLADDDREALSRYVQGLAPKPSPDGRLRIPVA